MKSFEKVPIEEDENQIPAAEKIGEGESSPVSPEEMEAAVGALHDESSELSPKPENFAESPAESPTETQPETAPEGMPVIDHRERDRALIEELRKVMREPSQEQREKSIKTGGGGNGIESPGDGNGGGGDGGGKENADPSQENTKTKSTFESRTNYKTCEVCKGGGKGKSYLWGLIVLKCPACGGVGRVVASVSESSSHVTEKSKKKEGNEENNKNEENGLGSDLNTESNLPAGPAPESKPESE